jgi:hypothetical protein
MKKLAFTQRKAQDATKAQTEATADLIDKLELATGIADDEMRPAMAALAGTGMEVKESHDLLAIALDVSVARGKSVQTVSEALAKAYNGQLTGLQRLGVKVTDASGDALTFSEVLEQLRKRFGGAARAAGRTDPLLRLTAAYNQAKEALGKAFLPLLRRFANYIRTTVVPWVKEELVPAVYEFTGWIQGEAIPWIKKLHDRFSRPGGFYDTVADTAGKVWDLAGALFGFTSAISGGGGGASVAGQGSKGQRVRGGGGSGGGAAAQTEAIAKAMQSMAEDVGDAAENLSDLLVQIDGLIGKESAIIDVVNALQRLNDVGRMMNPVTAAQDLWDARPWKAKGGFLRRAQGGMAGRWTLVGEHGPELISNRGYVKTASQTMGANMGGTVNITVNGAIDPVSTARQIERILAKGGRVTGRTGLAPA